MTPSLSVIEPRQQRLTFRKGELQDLFDRFRGGDFVAGLPLTRDVYGENVGDVRELTHKHLEHTCKNMLANVDSGTALVKTVTIAGQRMFGSWCLIKQMGATPSGKTHMQAAQDKIDQLAEEKNQYVAYVYGTIQMLVRANPALRAPLTVQLAKAANAKAPEVECIDDRYWQIDPPALTRALGQMEADLALAYQSVAEGVCTTIKGNFALIAGLSQLNAPNFHQVWQRFDAESARQLQMTDTFIARAGDQIAIAKETRAPWVLSHA